MDFLKIETHLIRKIPKNNVKKILPPVLMAFSLATNSEAKIPNRFTHKTVMVEPRISYRTEPLTRFEERLWEVYKNRGKYILSAVVLRYGNPETFKIIQNKLKGPINSWQNYLETKYSLGLNIDGKFGRYTASAAILELNFSRCEIKKILDTINKEDIDNFSKNYEYNSNLIDVIVHNKKIDRRDTPTKELISAISNSKALAHKYKQRLIESLGVKYMLGGRSKVYGFDCTGLVAHIFGGSIPGVYLNSEIIYSNSPHRLNNPANLKSDRAYILSINRREYQRRYDPNSRYGHAIIVFRSGNKIVVIEATSNANKVRGFIMNPSEFISKYKGWKIMDMWDYRILVQKYRKLR